VTAIYGVRGGLGATTLAVSLAFKLAAVTKSETALVDLDLQRGDVATFVNLVPVHSLATIATAPGEVDDIFLASTLTRHPSGVSILSAPAAMEEAELVTDREVGIALRLMRSQFTHTIVDTPRVITAPVAAAFEEADRILVLTDLSVPGVRAAHRAFELLARLEIPQDRAEFLITQVLTGPVEIKKAEQVMGREAFAIIPRDEDAAGSAMNDGVPLNGRPTRLTLAVDGLARRLAGLAPTSRGRRSFLKRIFPKGARP
jgi:pilus assembly protein CpaE